jgi:hypothetical protein
MEVRFTNSSRLTAIAVAAAMSALMLLTEVPRAVGQNPQVQEKLADIKQSSAANKQALAHYSWQEQETISLKGEVKDTKVYQVQMGPDGQQQKTELTNQQAQQGGREGRVKKHVVEKKTEEYQQYGQDIAALAKQYAPPDPQKLQAAFKEGNVSAQSSGDPGTVNLVIKNYVKPNDSMTIGFNRAQKAIETVHVASYLNDPSDAVTISARFAQIPGGPNHVDSTLINGVSKQLTVATQNSDYQPK